MSTTHVLHEQPAVFERILTGAKAFHLDIAPDVQAGDVLRLVEFSPAQKAPTGRELEARVTYAAHGAKGVTRGWSILSLAAPKLVAGEAAAPDWEPYATGICRQCKGKARVNRANVCLQCTTGAPEAEA